MLLFWTQKIYKTVINNNKNNEKNIALFDLEALALCRKRGEEIRGKGGLGHSCWPDKSSFLSLAYKREDHLLVKKDFEYKTGGERKKDSRGGLGPCLRPER